MPISRSSSLPVSLVVAAAWAVASSAGEQLTVLPNEIELRGPEASQRVLFHLKAATGLGKQLAPNQLKLQSSDDSVFRVEAGRVIAAGNGTATLTASWQDSSAMAGVRVSGFDQEHRWSFRNHVLPVMAKAGCNSGACHGALAGKGGFKLSLRGYDPDRDYHVMTRQARGRRIEFSDPGRSLILAKPSGLIAHKGGLRLPSDSRDYRVVAEWIASGADSPQETDPTIQRLEIFPDNVLLDTGADQDYLVLAHYSDGRREDVTPWVKFASTDEAVARVDPISGRLSVVGPGVGAITAWFSSKIAIARVISPYPNDVAAEVYANSPRNNFLDEIILERLQELRLPPSPPALENEFLRRSYLDAIGRLPTPQEAVSFFEDDSPTKMTRLIEQLLVRPEFVDYWSYKWSDLLLINGQKLRPNAVKSYYEWIRSHVADNTSWDEFVRLIVTAQGNSFENGATNFFALHQDPETMTENTSQAFLGLSIGCAKCHNHPLEKWTNNQYYGMANLFARVRAKGWGGDFRGGDGQRTLYVVSKGELIQPLTGRPQPPTPLDGASLSFDDPTDRRIHLAKWLTAPDNPYFARAITNRIWANFMGVGLVEQVDDMRMSNPATNDRLLSEAAAYLAGQDFDLKALMRLIMQSAAYQRSSRPLPGNLNEKRFYSRYYPRRMMAEVLLDAISDVTKVPTRFGEIEYPGADKQKTDFYPLGTRAIQLYDAAVASYFLKAFGRNPRQITCECERSEEPSMVQVLHIHNGDTVNKKLQAQGNRIDSWMSAELPHDKVIRDAYLAALSRYPTEKEQRELIAVLTESDENPRVLLEDLLWGILSSREFLFHH